MNRLPNLFLLFSLSSPAWAVPAQLTHQGRFVDADGVPYTEDATVTFRLMDSASGGSTVWEEEQTIGFINGFYSVVLGADEETNPLDHEMLDQWPLWLEVQLSGRPAMVPRLAVGSAAYARLAGVAEEVAGGPVDATEISISGTVVIDESGAWVGPSDESSLGWSDISGVPSDFADGVDDDTQRTDEDIRGAVSSESIDLAAGSTLDGVDLATTADLTSPSWSTLDDLPDGFADGIDNDTDSFADLGASCSDGGVPSWDAVLSMWDCTSVSDADTLAGLDCTDGQLASYDATAGAWACTDSIEADSETPDLRGTAADLTIGESNGGEPFESRDTPLAIPDDNPFGVTSSRNVDDAPAVETVSVDIKIDHDDMSQITVILGSPAGTTITLYSGGEGGTEDLDTNIGWVTASATGDLYSFYGEDPAGLWWLKVIDEGDGTEGTLDEWTLRINEEWDGTAFIGESLTIQGDAEVRGQLTMSAGSQIVFKDVDDDETLRIAPTGMTPIYKMRGGCIAGSTYSASQNLLTLSATCETQRRSTSSYWTCSGSGYAGSRETCDNIRIGSILLGD